MQGSGSCQYGTRKTNYRDEESGNYRHREEQKKSFR